MDWIRSGPDFEELTSHIYNNQDNKDFKITMNKTTYDLKKCKKKLDGSK